MTEIGLKIGEVKDIPLDLLVFDTNNPRFTPDHRPLSKSDADVIGALHNYEALEELILSIATNGYFNLEPLIVFGEKNTGPFVVLEGNRRLAAIKFLQAPELEQTCNISRPKIINKNFKETTKKIKVQRVKNREAARNLIGFKHINGPQKWQSYSKAIFAANWYLDERARGEKTTLYDIALSLGDKHDTIKRLVNSFLALSQAEKLDLFRVDNRAKKRPFYFSHLYTSLGRKAFQEYLGLPNDWMSDTPSKEPIPKSCLNKFQEILLFIYGSRSENIQPVIRTQNPDLKFLGSVFQNPKALKILQETRDLDKAYNSSLPEGEKFTTALITAEEATKQALVNQKGYLGDSASLEIAESLSDDASNLLMIMKFKAKEPISDDEDS